MLSHGIPPRHFNSRSAIEITSDQSWRSVDSDRLTCDLIPNGKIPHAKPHLDDPTRVAAPLGPGFS